MDNFLAIDTGGYGVNLLDLTSDDIPLPRQDRLTLFANLGLRRAVGVKMKFLSEVLAKNRI